HPYGRPLGGTDASTGLLDRTRVADFYTHFYRPGNARLLVVGDVTPDEARNLIEQRFGGWPAGDVPALPKAAAPPPAARAFYLVDKPDAPQSVIRIGNVGVARSTSDYHAIEVMNTMLRRSFTSPPNQNLPHAPASTYA